MKKCYQKCFSLLLAVIMVFCSIPITAVSENLDEPSIDTNLVADLEQPNPDNSVITNTINSPPGSTTNNQIYEIKSRREENVKHFRLPDGTIEAVAYSYAVHRKDSLGTWQDIDNNLFADNEKMPDHYVTDDLRVAFAKNYTPQQPLFTLQEHGYSISIKLNAANPLTGSSSISAIMPTTTSLASVTNAPTRTAELAWNTLDNAIEVDNASSIVYQNIRSNTNLEYVLDGNNIKENIILNAPTGNYTYTFELTLSGLRAELKENGSIDLIHTETNKIKYIIPIPFMYDANQIVSYAVYYTLTETGPNTYALSIIANEDWIHAADRAFPVVIDPHFEQQNHYDTYIDANNPHTNYGSVTDLCVSSSNIAYFKMNLPSLPNNTTVISGRFRAYYYYYDFITSGSLTAGAYQIINNWSDSGLTWNIANQYSNLGISTTPLDTASMLGGSFENDPQRATFYITDAMLSWYTNPISNYGIAIKREGGTNGSVLLKSFESGTAYRPCFIVSYTENPLPSGVYSIKNYVTGYFFDIMHNNSTAGSSLIQWEQHGGRNQLFKITYLETYNSYNFYSIRPMVNSGLGLYAPTSGTSRNATIENMTLEEKRYKMDSQQQWVLIEAMNGVYVIKNGLTSDSSYLTIDNNENLEAPIVTTSTPDYTALWQLVPWVGTPIEGITFQSYATGLIPGESFTYQACMYSSTIGCNGPVTYNVYNDDGTTTNKATINSSTGTLTAHKIGKICISATYIGAPQTLDNLTIVIEESLAGVYFFQNTQTEKYIQPGGSYLEQHSYDGYSDQRWQLIWEGAGYYKVKNLQTGLFMTAPDSSNSEIATFQQEASASNLRRQHWHFSLSPSGSYTIHAQSHEGTTLVLSVGDSLLDINSNGINIEQKNYSDDNNYRDHWYLRKMLPTSGSEIPYNPSLWNYNEVQERTNCYAYALNNQVEPGTNTLWYMQPGQASGLELDSWNINEDDVIYNVTCDAETLGFTFNAIGKYDPCPSGSYKVALVLDPNEDYHWYRQDPDGMWSHKLAKTKATNQDASGNLIYDPELANRSYGNYNYATFVGFFQISPLNNMYSNVTN